MAQQPVQGPNVERIRPSQQLEPNEEMLEAGDPGIPILAQQRHSSEYGGQQIKGEQLTEEEAQSKKAASQNQFNI